MNITVMSRAKFEEYCTEVHRVNSCVISITSLDEDFVDKNIIMSKQNGIKHVYRAMFDDTDGENGISRTQAKEIAEFVKQHSDIEQLIVHCGAGISRSAGVAAAIMVYVNKDDSPIFDNKRYSPNMRCYRYVLSELYRER